LFGWNQRKRAATGKKREPDWGRGESPVGKRQLMRSAIEEGDEHKFRE
jgi:hypothetical protein